MSKKAKITYPIVSGVLLAVTFCMCFLYWKLGWLYAVSYAVFMAATGLMISRTILHICAGDKTIKNWSINISGIAACGAFFATIQSNSWAAFKIEVCTTAILALYCVGERFLPDKNGDGIPDILQNADKVRKDISANYLYENMLFKCKDDVLSGQPDNSRPLCFYNNRVYTVQQAIEEGFDDLAKEGMDYIDELIKKERNEK